MKKKLLSRSTLQRKLRDHQAALTMWTEQALSAQRDLKMEIGTRDALREQLAIGSKQFEERGNELEAARLDRDASRQRAAIHERTIMTLGGRTAALASLMQLAVSPAVHNDTDLIECVRGIAAFVEKP